MIDQAKDLEKKNLPVVLSQAPYLPLSYLLDRSPSINISSDLEPQNPPPMPAQVQLMMSTRTTSGKH